MNHAAGLVGLGASPEDSNASNKEGMPRVRWMPSCWAVERKRGFGLRFATAISMGRLCRSVQGKQNPMALPCQPKSCSSDNMPSLRLHGMHGRLVPSSPASRKLVQVSQTVLYLFSAVDFTNWKGVSAASPFSSLTNSSRPANGSGLLYLFSRPTCTGTVS